MTTVEEALSPTFSLWNNLLSRPEIEAIFLHGSFNQKWKKTVTNDIDLLVVLDELAFTNWCSQNLLGFEHIRHLGDVFDLYLTDEDHYYLASKILGTQNCLMQRKELRENNEIFAFSRSQAFQIDFDPEEETNKLRAFIEENVNRYNSIQAYSVLKNWKTDIYAFTFHLRTILRFWLFQANHSWFNYFRNPKLYSKYHKLKF